MDILDFKPLVDGYDFNVGNNVREQQLEGGQPRQVKKFVGAIHTIGVTVALDGQADRQYFWAFWRKNQASEFKFTLQVDSYQNEECICKFSNSSIPKETLIGGFVRKISFTLYVTPIARSAISDAIIVDLRQSGNTGNAELFDLIANVWLPDATGV